MSSTWGNQIKVSVFGESHGKAIGVVIDGLPSGENLDIEKIENQMKRRKPGKSTLESSRKEEDIPNILSGVKDGKTTGTPLCATINNINAVSRDYKNIELIPRPGHADYTGYIKYNGYNDQRGGGHFSGRLTAPLVFAGGVCSQILRRREIKIFAHIYSIGSVYDTPINPVKPQLLQESIDENFPVINRDIVDKMKDEINNARQELDSVGGIIECCITGMPAGIGTPMFDGIENRISSMMFAIPAIKGIEFGSGFSCASMRGSEHNDAFMTVNGKVSTTTNNHGGILGGISSGMPIIFRVAIKPTPSIPIKQKSVDMSTGEAREISVCGRHDPCIVPRAVPVVESAAAIAIADMLREAGVI